MHNDIFFSLFNLTSVDALRVELVHKSSDARPQPKILLKRMYCDHICTEVKHWCGSLIVMHRPFFVVSQIMYGWINVEMMEK